MPARKMRIELFDSEGNKYKIAFEGQITREKAVRLLDLVELLGGMPSSEANRRPILSNELSKCDKVRMIIQKHFPIVWFSSMEIRSAYEQWFKEPVGLSTVSTYLARLTDRGLLIKMKASNRVKYRVASNFPQAALKQQIP